jgi:small conductance mechanosensitive channel
VTTLQQFQDYVSGILPAIGTFAVHVGIALLVYFIAAKVINWASKLFRKWLEGKNWDQSAVFFMTNLFCVAFKVFVAITCLIQLGLKEATVLAALGSIGVGLGLALQGGMANLAGGILILTVKPFRVGDYIIETSEKQEGSVKAIDIFYTTLMTYDNRKIVIPNKNLTDHSVVNVTAEGQRMLDIKVGIGYDDDLGKAREVLQRIAKDDPDILDDKGIIVYVDELAESTVEVGLRTWVSTADFWPAKWRMQENILQEFKKEGISIAFNQLDVHLDSIISKGAVQ